MQFLAEWIITTLEPARAITKVRTLSSYMKKTSGSSRYGWIYIQPWCWIAKAATPDRSLVQSRCVCKEFPEKKGATANATSIKLRICNLHFFTPMWMAQASRRCSEAGLTACRGSTPPWSRARVDRGVQIKLKCSDRAILAERRSQKNKKKNHVDGAGVAQNFREMFQGTLWNV